MIETTLKLRLLGGGCALAMCLSGLPALAQTADDLDAATVGSDQEDFSEDIISDEMVVTGIRQSISDSLALKRETNSIVEAISAEDIGKLPDVSIADSLARLPGVTAQRVRGRAQQISIRGLGPDFSLALLNGREVVSAGNNRGIEFDQFPSELISQALVYKTPDARLAATGIAGTVDLRTVRPLEFGRRQVTVSGEYVNTDNGSLNPDFSDEGYRLFGSYIDTFADNRIGVAIAITDQENPQQFFSRELKTAPGQTELTEGGIYIPRDNPRSGVVSREFDRTSVAGTLQFEPNDRFQIMGDVFYTDSEDAGIFRGVETPIASWSGVDATNITGSAPFADSATYTGVAPIIRTDTEGNDVELLSLGLNTSFNVTENFKLVADFSTSSLDRTDIDYESYAGLGARGVGSGDPAATDTLTYTFPSGGSYGISAGQDYTSPANVVLTDPGGWGQVGFLRSPDIEDDLDQIRLEADYDTDLPFIAGIKAGYINTDRRKSFQDNAFFVRPGAGFAQVERNGGFGPELAVPAASVEGATDSGSIGLDVIAYDPSSLIEDGTYILEETGASAFLVDEDIDTYYAMLDVEGLDDWQFPMTGNVGFQVVDVKQGSTGTLPALGPVPGSTQTLEETYTDFLPSANIGFEVAESTFVKLAYAQTVTRPRLDQLAANINVSSNPLVCPDTDGDQIPDSFIDGAFNPPQQTCLSFSGGNPFLQPFRSESYDLSFERYFGDVGVLSLAVFQKELTDYVQDGSTAVDASTEASLLLGSSFVTANPNAGIVALNGPANLESGSIFGIEVALKMSLDEYLPFSLRGFGFGVSYSYSDANVDDVSGVTIPIPGFSENVANGDFYFERDGFRARVSGRYRDEFLSEVQRFDGGLDGAFAEDEFILDAQIGYDFQEGILEGFGINFEAYNLTDEPFRTFNDLDGSGGPLNDTFISRREDYGTTYNATISYKF